MHLFTRTSTGEVPSGGAVDNGRVASSARNGVVDGPAADSARNGTIDDNVSKLVQGAEQNTPVCTVTLLAELMSLIIDDVMLGAAGITHEVR